MTEEKKRSAYQWGKDHNVPAWDLTARKAAGSSCGQAAWFEKVCPRADLLLISLRIGAADTVLLPEFRSMATEMVEELVREKVLRCGEQTAEEWAEKWLETPDEVTPEETAAVLAPLPPASDIAWPIRALTWLRKSPGHVADIITRGDNDEKSAERCATVRKYFPKWNWEE